MRFASTRCVKDVELEARDHDASVSFFVWSCIVSRLASASCVAVARGTRRSAPDGRAAGSSGHPAGPRSAHAVAAMLPSSVQGLLEGRMPDLALTFL
eukprot:3776170-Prymnesium_polylepis.1